MKTLDQRYEIVSMDQLAQFPGNPRKNDVATILESVEENGFYGAVLVQKSTNRILAGHGRYAAALAADATELPAIIIDCDDDRAEKIVLIDNKANDKAGYDEELLLTFLQGMGDLAGTGYVDRDLTDLEKLLSVPTPTADLAGAHGEPDDDIFFPEIKMKVSPDTFDRWRYALDFHRGKNDVEKFVQLLDEIEGHRAGDGTEV